MPTYVSPQGGQYRFRQVVPEALRKLIGRREIKKSLGSDYREALSKAKLLAVEVDKLFADARAQIARRNGTKMRVFNALEVISDVTPEVMRQLRAWWLAAADETDLQRRAGQYAHMSTEEVAERNGSMEPMMRRALASGEVREFVPWARQCLNLAGYRLDGALLDTAEERRLTLDMLRAALQSLRLQNARDAGEDPPVDLPAEPIVNPLLAPAPAPAPAPALQLAERGGLTLSGLIKCFLADWEKLDRRPMLRKHRTALPLLLEVVGDRPIAEIKQLHLNQFFDFVQKLPPRWSDACRQQKITATALALQQHPVTIGKKTFEDSYLASVRIFLKTCRRTHQDEGFPTTLTTEGVPFYGERTGGEFKQRAMRPAELRRFFEGPELAALARDRSTLHQYWLPVISLYTGARINELCQINPQFDIRTREGVLCLELTKDTPAGPGVRKSMKMNKNRCVPVHRHLLELGLAEYLDAVRRSGAEQLFPAWPPNGDGRAGAMAGKWLREFLAEIGLHGVPNDSGKALRGAHMFRHTLLTYGRVQKLKLRCITGHDGADELQQEEEDNPVAAGYEDQTLISPVRKRQQLLDQLDYKLAIPKPISL